MATEERNVLVCLRIERTNKVVDGSIQSNCEECESLVWVSVSGQKMMMEESVRLLCEECSKPLMPTSEDDPTKVLVRPEVFDETMSQIMRDAQKDGVEPGNLYRFLKFFLSALPLSKKE